MTESHVQQASDEDPPTHPQTLTDSYEWIRTVETLPTDPHPEDYKVETNVSVVEMDYHTHVLDNHGYTVERIAFDAPYGCRFYCVIR